MGGEAGSGLTGFAPADAVILPLAEPVLTVYPANTGHPNLQC